MDKSIVLINITGRRFLCVHKKGYIVRNSPDLLEVGKTYLELKSDPFGLNLALDDCLLIMVNEEKPMYVDKCCFILIREAPKDLFLIPLTLN